MSFHDLLSCRDTLIGKYDAAISAKGDISQVNQLIHISAHASLIDAERRTQVRHSRVLGIPSGMYTDGFEVIFPQRSSHTLYPVYLVP